MNGVKSFVAKVAPVRGWIYSLVFCLSVFSAAQAFAASDVLFEQSSLGGTEGNYLVPVAEHRPPSTGAFHMILWQPNPLRPPRPRRLALMPGPRAIIISASRS